MLSDQKVQVNVFYPTYFPIIGGTGEWDIYWKQLYSVNDLRLPDTYANLPEPYTYYGMSQSAANARADWIISYVTGENITNAFLLLLYCFIYAIISSLGYALIYILGGSTGGSDFITIYLSQEKNKKVGLMFIIVNAICMLIGITIGSYGAGCLVDSQYFSG
jgi:uncharacterized membrane-anchored protein YitT (DUF2179 family)